MILKSSSDEYTKKFKGINNIKELIQVFNCYIDQFGINCIETDIRAMYSPLRLKVIKSAAKKTN